MLPVRCFSCNKVLGAYEKQFEDFKQKSSGCDPIPYQEFFDSFRIERYCCRKIFLTHIDVFHQKTISFPPNVEARGELETKKIVIAE